MIIGIDCRAVSESGGIGEYTRQLTKNLITQNSQQQFVLFFADGLVAEKFKQTNVKIIVLPAYKYKKFLPLIYIHLLVPILMRQSKCDLMLFPANIIPLGWRGQSVLVIHDLAVYKLPELFPEQVINLDRRVLVPSSVRRAKRIIAVSHSTKNDIVALFKIAPEKISVVPEGGDFDHDKSVTTALPSGLITKKYFLFVGTIEPRKNLIRLIEAYKKFVQSGQNDYDLVLAGKSGWKNDDIFAAIKSANQELGSDRIKYLGFISNEQKAVIYQNAYALVMPSIYEGFGLPVAEALQFNLPLILADNSSLPEVGGEAALYIQTESVASITEAFRKLVADSSLYEQLTLKSQQRASQFTWATCAEGVLKALRSVKIGDK